MTSYETVLLPGKPAAEAVYARLKHRIAALKERGITPGLAAVLVGDNPASQIYVRSKTRRFTDLNLLAGTFRLPEHTTEAELLELIDELNRDQQYHGLLVQLPLPAHIDADIILDRVSPAKDVDGFHPYNLGHLLAGRPLFIPCTPHGILELLRHYNIETPGQHAVVVGRSNIVGKPIAALLALKTPAGNATVTICHTATRNLQDHTRQADILIVASGYPGLVTADMVKPGVVVIDVGINRIKDDSEKGYHLEGDVNTAELMGIARAITPVPGGVGLMTVAMLVSNTVLAAERSASARPEG